MNNDEIAVADFILSTTNHTPKRVKAMILRDKDEENG